MENNLIGRLIDIQKEADRVLNSNYNSEILSSFFKYSNEIRAYLIENIDDSQIQNLIVEIPKTELKDILRNSKIVEFLGFDLLGLFKKNNNLENVKDVIYLIKNKYASIELILKNNFNTISK